MDFVIKKDEIVILESGNAYKALNFIVNDGKGYVVFYKLSDEIDKPLNFDVKNVVFGTEVIDGDDYFVDIVQDDELIKKLKNVYLEKMKNI